MHGYECLLFIMFFSPVSVYTSVLRNELFPLHIVHYNDFHARFEETSVKYAVCETNDTRCLGGFARLYQEITTLLRDYPDALLLNAGDAFQGTYWYTLFKWNVTQHFINMLPNDVHAIGNHEFDDGIEGLVPYLQALQAPVVAANLDSSKEPTLNGLYQPHVVITRNGRKIGIIGLITTETRTSSNPGGAVILDPIPVVQREAQLLTEKGVDIIIVLSHCGLYVDQEIAKTAGENIDIIVGGHTHSLLWNGTSPSNETVAGPYPLIVETQSDTGHKVLIVTASAFTKYLGNITTYFDNDGKLQTFDGTPIFLNRSIPENQEIKAKLQPYLKQIYNIVHEVIGHVDDDLLANPCGLKECALGNLVSNAFLTATRQKNPTNLTSIAFLLRNNVRVSMPKGVITRGDIVNIVPFTNKVVSFDLAGKYILEALERCLISYWELKPYTSPWMPMVSGLKVTLNTTTPRRIMSVYVKEGDEYEPLNINKMYQVTTLDFLRRGGGGFNMFTNHGINVKETGGDAQVLEEYVRKETPIASSTLMDNRLTVVH